MQRISSTMPQKNCRFSTRTIRGFHKVSCDKYRSSKKRVRLRQCKATVCNSYFTPTLSPVVNICCLCCMLMLSTPLRGSCWVYCKQLYPTIRDTKLAAFVVPRLCIISPKSELVMRPLCSASHNWSALCSRVNFSMNWIISAHPL